MSAGHYRVSDLRNRGWTDAMVAEFLGAPDAQARNPKGARRSPVRLYDAARVHQVEAGDGFAERLRLARQRRERQSRASIDPQEALETYRAAVEQQQYVPRPVAQAAARAWAADNAELSELLESYVEYCNDSIKNGMPEVIDTRLESLARRARQRPLSAAQVAFAESLLAEHAAVTGSAGHVGKRGKQVGPLTVTVVHTADYQRDNKQVRLLICDADGHAVKFTAVGEGLALLDVGDSAIVKGRVSEQAVVAGWPVTVLHYVQDAR